MAAEPLDRKRREDHLPVSQVGEPDGHAPLLAEELAKRLTVEEQSEFFCSLVDSALDAIIAHAPDGTILCVNRGAAELLGYTPEELMGIQPYGWVASEVMAGAPRRIESILHDGRLTFQSGAKRKDGTIIPTEVRSRRVDTTFGPVVVAVIRDVRDRIEAQQTLERLAFHDPLTRVGNRAYFEDRLTIAIADAKRYGDRLGLAYIDLDEFKPVNDRYGHAIGDEVLIEIGRRLRDCTRAQDALARMGGDEFVVLLPRIASDEELQTVAERLVNCISEPILASGHVLHIQASVGLASFDPAADDARALVVKADLAMYLAKRDPAHPWLIYRDGMHLPDTGPHR